MIFRRPGEVRASEATALRLIAAPFILASPGPGLMAICTGSEIVYISMQTGQPVGEADGHPASACPFFGITHVVTSADLPLVAPQGLAVRITPQTRTALANPVRPDADYNPRAPPLPA